MVIDIKCKKASFGVGTIILLFMAVITIVIVAPIMASGIKNAQNSVYKCDTNNSVPVVTDTSFCTNESGISYLLFNQSATPSGLSSAETTILGLITTVIVIGIIVFMVAKLGIIKV